VRDSIAYIILDGEQHYLCVLNQEAGEFYRFPVALKGMLRIAHEAAGYANIAMGGFGRVTEK